MKAFVKSGHQPREGGLTEVEVGAPGPGEALIRVQACGVCGSDLHAYWSDAGFDWVKTPVILGHEFSGVVESVGSDVGRVTVTPGDRVVPVAIQGCGVCELCQLGSTQLCAEKVAVGLDRNGGMAEWALVSARHLVPVPSGLDLGLAALCEPLAVALHAVKLRSNIKLGSTVVVSGPGPIGVLCALVARLSGARVVITGLGADSESRLPTAQNAGLQTANLDDAPLEEHMRENLGTGAPDAWIESSGSVKALDSALSSVRPGGAITVVGLYAESLNFLPTSAVRREISLCFSYACNYPDYLAALNLLGSGALDPRPLISTYSLGEAARAFEEARKSKVVKAMLSAPISL